MIGPITNDILVSILAATNVIMFWHAYQPWQWFQKRRPAVAPMSTPAPSTPTPTDEEIACMTEDELILHIVAEIRGMRDDLRRMTGPSK